MKYDILEIDRKNTTIDMGHNISVNKISKWPKKQ